MFKHAVIFDLDGVLTDTAAFHFQAWQTLARDLRIEFTAEDNEQLKGVSRLGSLRAILAKGNVQLSAAEEHRLSEQKNHHYQSLIAQLSPVDLFDGVPELFDQLRRRKSAIGLASASKNAKMVLRKLEILDQFDYIADAASVPSKPDPALFLLNAKALGVSPANCVGVEDAVSGIEAIKSADMFAVGIGDDRILTNADIVVSEPREIDIDRVLNLAGFSA